MVACVAVCHKARSCTGSRLSQFTARPISCSLLGCCHSGNCERSRKPCSCCRIDTCLTPLWRDECRRIRPNRLFTCSNVAGLAPLCARSLTAGPANRMTQFAKQRWDAIVVGAGHNGLTCAAYLARAGKKVLVLESRARIGGACTLEEPWPGVRLSPCACLAGLLHPVVIQELNLPSFGYEWTPASNGLFVPFLDGSSIQLFDDDERCEGELRRFAPNDIKGFRAMSDVIRRLRDKLRPADEGDVWIGEPPTGEELDERIGNDDEARSLLFEWSMAEFVERYLRDERLQVAYLGQGVIGTNASPFDPGTASIRFHHSSGRLGGLPGSWGYVKGGMGMVSFFLADAAQRGGATIACGVPVAQILPGEGIVLEDGERIHAPVVVSNADGRVTLQLLGDAADSKWRAKVESIPIEGCTLKVNVWL